MMAEFSFLGQLCL